MGQPKKIGKIYYANTQVNGVRLRECLKTENWQEALRRQKELVEQVEAGQITAAAVANREWLKYTWSEALDALLADRAGLAEQTVASDKARAMQVKRLIGDKRVSKTTADTIKNYQKTRLAEGTTAGRAVNMEVTLMRLILKKAKRWNRIADDVENLPENRGGVDRVLSPDEKRRLFEIAASKEQWYRALYCAVITVNTTARNNREVLRSRLRDVDFFKKVWNIPSSKTKAGIRKIRLNYEALHAFAEMRRIVEALCGGDPDYYFFPACEHKIFDASRHQKSVRTAWRKLTVAAGLKGLRVYDLRHQCITEMAENDVPPDVMEALAGQVSAAARRRYVHIRDEAIQKAVDSLPGTGTGLFRPLATNRVPQKQ